jgi:hypothetical protein
VATGSDCEMGGKAVGCCVSVTNKVTKTANAHPNTIEEGWGSH